MRLNRVIILITKLNWYDLYLLGDDFMLLEYLQINYEVNEPIFLSDIDLPVSDTNLRQMFKVLCDSGKIQRYDTGIYYIKGSSRLKGGTNISASEVARCKYISRKNRIEGNVPPKSKVVVIEDLISTGGSVIEVVNVLREAGAEVLGVASIFTYGMQKGLDRLKEANVKNVSLTNFDVIARVAADEGYIKGEDIDRLIKFRNNPSDESWIKGE